MRRTVISYETNKAATPDSAVGNATYEVIGTFEVVA